MPKAANVAFTPQIIIPLLVAIVSSSATAGVTALVGRYFAEKELSSANAKIDHLTRENETFMRNWKNVTEKGVTTKRFISYQLEELAVHVAETDKKDEKRQRTHTVEIMGINALGPIHGGKRILSDLLQNGAHLRVLVLDPVSTEWTARIAQENDALNYNGAELQAALFDLAEVKNRVPGSGEGSLEIRKYAQKPDRSLIIVDRSFADGFAMGNRYPPDDQKGKEGLEGAAYIEPADTGRT